MENMTRKELLKRGLIAGAAVAGAGTILANCKKPAPPADTADASNGGAASCDDVSGLSDADIATRTQNEYVDKTPMPEKRCDNCALYTQPEGGSACGGCQVVKGPIASGGYCKLWVAMG